jgi:hypothetical protein
MIPEPFPSTTNKAQPLIDFNIDTINTYFVQHGGRVKTNRVEGDSTIP